MHIARREEFCAPNAVLPIILVVEERCMGEGLFQPMHLLVIFFIALLVFGPKKLPELGKGIGEGIRALKEGLKDSSTSNEAKQSTNAPEQGASAQKQ